MKNVILGLLAILTISGCQGPQKALATSPPGWRVPVSSLFIDISAFPQKWEVDFSDPKDKQNDPTINAVFREWVGPGALPAWQNISRAYSLPDAEELYRNLRESQYSPNRTLPADISFAEFSPPKEISFTSQTADDYYFACGVWRFSYCEVVARYRNYVTNVHLPLISENENDGGFTYEEMEMILRGMDQQFTVFFESIAP
jgi:hypothetical protein